MNKDYIHSDRQNFQNENRNYHKYITKKCTILVSVIGFIVIASSLALFFILTRKKKDDIQEPPVDINEPTSIIITTPVQPIPGQKLQKEFQITTNVGDLKRIYVTQKSTEENILNGNLIKTEVKRNTNYDIYIISEEIADESNKLFYSKMYTCAVSIVSECISTEEGDCQPHRLVDLTAPKANRRNIRVLNGIEDFKDIPISLCLFNITDNNFITSMTCPESLSESKKNEIILDLYFFRPPAIQRADKENDNITITINEDKAMKKIYIRETNGGLCNIYDNFGSMCTTDMNTTTDLDGNLLSYDELAITNIITDENNSYIKNKVTHLIDISNTISGLDPAKYKNALDSLLPLLEPYMKVDIHFTSNNFSDLYSLVQDKIKFPKKKQFIQKKQKQFRNLMEYASEYTKTQDLFTYTDIGGIQVNLNLKLDSGLNTQAMRAYSQLLTDDQENHLSTREEFSDIQKIIDELIELSNAGNSLATKLYERIKDKLDEITNDISLRIKGLINLLEYYDLSDVFDATLSLDYINKLPITIVEESNILVSKLTNIYERIKTGNTKNNVDSLSNNIYNYIKQSHILIKKLFDNLTELKNTLSSKNNKLTEITTYYLNHTSSSYINIIKEAEEILANYFKNEYDNIYPKIDTMIKDFEDVYLEDLKKEKNIINNLYNKLVNRNFTIELANEDDYKKIILNLYNSDKYITEIIEKIKEYIRDEIGIKDSGYFTSNYDINLNNNTFSSVISEAKEVAQKLDKDEYIDKKFDEIMTNFRESYTKIIKYMETQKSEQFPLDENTLDTTLFDSNGKNKIESNLTSFRVQISNKIKEENDYYIDNIKTNLTAFLDKNLDTLNSIISDLDILFSEESLKDLADSFKKAFESCLKKILDDIKKNENLAKQYFDNLSNVINNDNYLIELLKTYKTNEIPRRWIIFGFKKFIDYITSKEKTSAYIRKYNTFIANFDYSKNYLAKQLYLDIVNEYKTVLTRIRELLQSIKNNKLTEKYPDFTELSFFNENERIINKLFNRLHKYLSDDIFNNNYINLINANKSFDDNYLNTVKNYINKKHNTINNLGLFSDNSNDFCINYKRKLCYGCTNCDYYYYAHDRYCLPLSNYGNNDKNLIKSSIESDKNLIQFRQTFNNFYNKISEKVNSYNSKLKYLQDKFIIIKNETLNRQFTLNYLQPIQNTVNSFLSQKYGDEIVKASYNYYQKLIEERVKTILDNVTKQWNSTFNTLLSQIEENYDKFKNSIYEFGVMAQIYETIIRQGITINYFDSIVLFQKTEFNYTISYYYNYFIKLVNEAYQYVLSKIPVNENGFNDILDQRKSEINLIFQNFINDIKKSQKDALSNENQLSILNVPSTNFFKVNNILTNNIATTSRLLKDSIRDIEDYEGEEGNDISLISRFYLENRENGKQIEEFYDPVNHELFVYLNLEKFEKIMISNWIFDQDDFINRLNQTLFETTKEINHEISIQKESYTNDLENEVEKYFVDDSIENKITKLYLSAIKDLTNNQINIINTNINEMINKVIEKINSESQRLEGTATSYNSNYTKFENTLKQYQNKIFSDINITLFKVLEDFYHNIYKNVYTNCIDAQLNEYLRVSKEITSLHNDEYPLYNSSYNIGETINNIVIRIVGNYKEITTKKIESKYREYYDKIKSAINLDNIQKTINEEINNSYKLKLLKSLQKYAIYNPGDAQYKEYDFDDIIQNEINSVIANNKNNINNQILLTKGNNYEAQFQCNLDFSLSGINIVQDKCDSFKKLLTNEKQEQNNKINKFLQGIITTNFDDLLNNIIPTFGTVFFDRIIKYNENFKIKSLYNNLEYSLSQTLLYYLTLNVYTDVEALPKDIKIRLYNLNNLDLTVENKNKQILKLLDKKISEFIKESKNTIMKEYISHLQEDVSIERSFNELVLKRIDANLNTMKPEMEKNYQTKLELFLKDKLIDSYSKTINEKTREMVRLVNEQKEELRSKIDDLFSLDSDRVLYEVNEKINNTLDAINEYSNYFETFIISNGIKDYLSSYGSSTIKPIFEKFKIELNKATKDKIQLNIDKNSENIVKLNPNDFILQSNRSYQYFNTNYFENISNSINSYGPDDYKSNLDLERSQKRQRLLRRLEGTETEEEIAQESYERIADNGIEETFQKIISTSTNVKNYFDSLEAFRDFDKTINKYKNDINNGYKNSKTIISKNEYEEGIDNYLNEKLTNLTNIANNYYDKINESYYYLRDYLNKSLDIIHNSLNKCENITYITFNEEYDKIANETNETNTKYTKNQDKLNRIEYSKKTEHKENKVYADVFNNREYSEFKFDLILEGTTHKKPRVIANIVDKSRPKKVDLNISSPFGTCGENINQLEIEFNDANYTMNIDYSGGSNITVSTFTNFEKYKYSTEFYQIGETNETVAVEINGYIVEYKVKCKKQKTKVLKNKFDTEVDEKKYNETEIIQG